MPTKIHEKTCTNSHYHAPSVCPLDCPDACSLDVEVQAGRIVKIKGSKANPMTKGVICGKVSKYYPEFVHGKHRLTQPLKRVGAKGSGEFEPISWEQALDLCYAGIQRGIQQYGAESVMPLNYSGPHGQLAGGSMDRRFFYKLGATQLQRSPLCAGVRSMAYRSLFGDYVAMAQEQAVDSDLIILWGTNTSTTYLHLMKIIKQARQNGAKIIVINPERIKIAEQADLFLQITPASDAYFALAMANEFNRLGLIDKEKLAAKVSGLDAYLAHARDYDSKRIPEICGISSADAEAFIQLCRNAERMSMQTGVGLERSKNGGSALRAAMALSVLLGQFGHKGQGQMGYYSSAYPKTIERLQRPDLLASPTRTFNIVDVADHLLDRQQHTPVSSVFIYNHNPVAMHPDQNKMIKALSQDELFVIGCEIVMTDSMKFADVILPACSSFEYADVYLGYGHNYAQRCEAVLPRVGEALPNTEIFRRLSQRFGFTDPEFSDSDETLQAQTLDLTSPQYAINNITELANGSALSTQDSNHIWLSDMPAHERIQLFDAALESEFGYGLPRYEPPNKNRRFTLISAAPFHRSNSTFGASNMDLENLSIHPQDAHALKINNGDTVRAFNHKGEVILKALLTDKIAPGVVSAPKGAWRGSSPTGQTVNALIDNQSKTDIGNGAAFYDTYVDVQVVA